MDGARRLNLHTPRDARTVRRGRALLLLLQPLLLQVLLQVLKLLLQGLVLVLLLLLHLLLPPPLHLRHSFLLSLTVH